MVVNSRTNQLQLDSAQSWTFENNAPVLLIDIVVEESNLDVKKRKTLSASNHRCLIHPFQWQSEFETIFSDHAVHYILVVYSRAAGKTRC